MGEAEFRPEQNQFGAGEGEQSVRGAPALALPSVPEDNAANNFQTPNVVDEQQLYVEIQKQTQTQAQENLHVQLQQDDMQANPIAINDDLGGGIDDAMFEELLM